MSRSLCPVWQRCGGCPWIALDQEEQRARKLSSVSDLFSDIGVPVRFDVAVSPDAYRNRIRLRVTEGVPTFFNEEKSLSCAVLESSLRRALEELRAVTRLDRSLLRGIAHLELRNFDLDGQAGLLLTPCDQQSNHPGPDESARARTVREALPFRALVQVASVPAADFPAVSSKRRTSPAEFGLQRRPLLPDLYQLVPLDGFLQVNDRINRALVEAVVRGAMDREVRRAADLYCGSGNFGLALARSGVFVVGVEKSVTSVEAARLASQAQGLRGDYLASDVAALLESDRGALLSAAELAVVDPPRAGLKGALDPLLRLSPRHLALCSCNPVSLARDVRQLRAGGYELESLMLFDMFCHTEHVEVLAWLRRTDR